MAEIKLTNAETGPDDGGGYGSAARPQVIVGFDAECSECKQKFHARRLLTHGPPHDADVPPARFVLLPASAVKLTCVTRGCQENVFLSLLFD